MSIEKFKGISRPKDVHVHILNLCLYLYIAGAVYLILSRPICPSLLTNLILFC